QLRNIEVLAMKVDKVTYKQRGKENVISSSQVESVKWDDPPEAFAKAEVANTLKRFDDAAQLYLTAAKDEKAREVIRLEAQFLAGRACLMAAGGNKTKADAAGKVVEDYVNAAPDGFHLPEAKLILGKVKILTGDAAGAEDLMAVVEADAGRGGWPGHWVAQAQFVKAQAQSAQGKHDDARNSYKMVVTTVGAALGQGPLHNKDLLLLQTEAKVMQGETFIQQKYYDDALAYFRALASSGGAGLKAAARTGEGQILYLQGRDKADVRRRRSRPTPTPAPAPRRCSTWARCCRPSVTRRPTASPAPSPTSRVSGSAIPRPTGRPWPSRSSRADDAKPKRNSCGLAAAGASPVAGTAAHSRLPEGLSCPREPRRSNRRAHPLALITTN
ncbi:MAG: tetratricopeptide repeat protein, partial [Planctomycetota bacterium]